MTARKRTARDNAPTPAPTCGPGEVFTARSLIASGAHARATGTAPLMTWVALSPTCAARKVPTTDPAARVEQLELFAEIAATFAPRRKAARARTPQPLQRCEDAGAAVLSTDDQPQRASRLVWLRIYYRTMDDRIAFVDAQMSPGAAQAEIARAGVDHAGCATGAARLYPAPVPHVVAPEAHSAAWRAGDGLVTMPSQLGDGGFYRSEPPCEANGIAADRATSAAA